MKTPDAIPEIVEGCYAIRHGAASIPVSMKFTGKPDMGAEMVGEALIALDDVVRRSVRVFDAAAGIQLRDKMRCRVTVDELKRGSFLERVFLDILLGGNDEARQLVFQLGAKAAEFSPHAVPVAISLVTGSLLTWGGIHAINKFRGSKASRPMIEAHNSIVIASSKCLNISEGAFAAILNRVRGVSVFSRSAVRAMQPGKGGAAGDLHIGEGAHALVIPREAMAELPEPDDMTAIADERTTDFRDLELTIVASDMERAEHGWAAYLPESHAFGGTRIRLELDPAVQPSELMYKETVVCSGHVVTAAVKAAGVFKPRKIVVREVK